jgi:hypothetical protein
MRSILKLFLRPIGIYLFLFLIIPVCTFGQSGDVIDSNILRYLKLEKHEREPDAKAAIISMSFSQKLIAYEAVKDYDITIKVFSMDAVDDGLLDVIIPSNGVNAKIKKFSATTYNLEDGIIKKSVLTKNDLEESKIIGKVKLKQFSMPNVKDGSVIHYTFQIRSAEIISKYFITSIYPIDYFKLTGTFYNYEPFKNNNNYRSSYIKVAKEDDLDNTSGEALFYNSIRGDRQTMIWVRKNVPAIIKETYGEPPYREYIEFSQHEKSKKGNAKVANKQKVEEFLGKGFGGAYQKQDFFDKLVKKFSFEGLDSLQIAKNVYNFAKDSLIENNEQSYDLKFGSLTYKNILHRNAFLVSFYNYLGFAAEVCIVGLKNEYQIMPDSTGSLEIYGDFARVAVKDSVFLCDADLKKTPFGHLRSDYYNKLALILNSKASVVLLPHDLGMDRQVVSVTVEPIPEKVNRYELKYEYKYGIYSSIDMRGIEKDSLKLAAQLKKNLEAMQAKFNYDNFKYEIFHKNTIDTPIRVIASLEFEIPEEEDMLFLDPYVSKIFNGVNPLGNASERKSNIDFNFNYKLDYRFRITVDDRLKIDDLPQNTNIQFGSVPSIIFKTKAYVSPDGKQMQAQYSYQNNAATYTPEEYTELTTFLGHLVKNFNQKVVVQKK